MKHIKTFEFQTKSGVGPLGHMYSGRLKNILKIHCKMLDNLEIPYEVYVEEDPSRMDLVFVVVKDEYQDFFYDKIKKLGYHSLDITLEELEKMIKYDNIEEYLRTRPIQEKKILKNLM